MIRRIHLGILASLWIIPAALVAYRVAFMGYSLVPTIPGKAYKVVFEGTVAGDPGQEVSVRVALPQDHGGLQVTEEHVESGVLSFSLLFKDRVRWGLWSGPLEGGFGFISYSAILVKRPSQRQKQEVPSLGEYPPDIDKGQRTIALEMVEKWKGLDLASRFKAIREALLNDWSGVEVQEGHIEAWRRMMENRGKSTAIAILFRAAGLPTKVIEGLVVSGKAQAPITKWLEVWTGGSWERMAVEDMALIPPSMVVIPLRGDGGETVEVDEGKMLGSYWSVSQERLSGWREHFERIRTSAHPLDRWSLFRLPEQYQETFRILMLVPLGALIVCILRNVVGFPTFGVFMPVLMALAFRNTGLAYGLGIFSAVTLVGYVLRRFLERLRLLLVPRLSVVLSVVILMFTFVALLGNQFGRKELMAVGLIPFVILTMTIERMFVIAEETGVRVALRTAAGSAMVASLTYELVGSEALQLTFFVYPELLLMVAGLQVLVGRYTGYRLSELVRFKVLGRSS